jgi:tripartite-type tricarboxylate transporter receptor subunit TctC
VGELYLRAAVRLDAPPAVGCVERLPLRKCARPIGMRRAPNQKIPGRNAAVNLQLSIRRTVAGVLALVSLAITHSIAAAATDDQKPAGATYADPSAGRTITFIIGYGVDTGYDIYSRIVGRYIGKYLPGRPNVVMQNMPGAGSLQAINYLYNIAPKDGTVLGMIDQAAALTQLISPRGFHADVAKFNWIGRVASNTPVLFAWHSAPVQKIDDAFAKQLIVSATGQNSRMMSSLLKNMLGLKLNILTGYPSSADSELAMQRGEVEAMTMPWSILRAQRPDWLADKKINLLLQLGVETNAGLQAVSLVTSLAKDDRQREILTLMTSDAEIGRSIMSPPGEPAARVAELRAAYLQAVRDPGLLAEVARAHLDLDPLPGDKLQAVVQGAALAKPDLVSAIKKLADVAQ